MASWLGTSDTCPTCRAPVNAAQSWPEDFDHGEACAACRTTPALAPASTPASNEGAARAGSGEKSGGGGGGGGDENDLVVVAGAEVARVDGDELAA